MFAVLLGLVFAYIPLFWIIFGSHACWLVCIVCMGISSSCWNLLIHTASVHEYLFYTWFSHSSVVYFSCVSSLSFAMCSSHSCIIKIDLFPSLICYVLVSLILWIPELVFISPSLSHSSLCHLLSADLHSLFHSFFFKYTGI